MFVSKFTAQREGPVTLTSSKFSPSSSSGVKRSSRDKCSIITVVMQFAQTFPGDVTRSLKIIQLGIILIFLYIINYL